MKRNDSSQSCSQEKQWTVDMLNTINKNIPGGAAAASEWSVVLKGNLVVPHSLIYLAYVKKNLIR